MGIGDDYSMVGMRVTFSVGSTARTLRGGDDNDSLRGRVTMFSRVARAPTGSWAARARLCTYFSSGVTALDTLRRGGREAISFLDRAICKAPNSPAAVCSAATATMFSMAKQVTTTCSARRRRLPLATTAATYSIARAGGVLGNGEILDGGDGNDWLIGGLGFDNLTGGAGLNTFVLADDPGHAPLQRSHHRFRARRGSH